MKRDEAIAHPAVFRLFLVDTFVGNAMIPVFSIFLPILAITLGADPLQVGLVGGTANAVYAFMPFIMGRFSNRRKSRKFLVIASLALLTVVSLLYGVSSNPSTLIVLRIAEGTGWSMFWPTIEAEMTLGGRRDPRKSLSLFNAVWSGASASGPIIGSLATLLLSLHAAFFVTAGILFSTLVLNIVQLAWRGRDARAQEPESPRPEQMRARLPSVADGEPTGRRSRRLLNLVLASNALIAVSFSVLITFYGPYARSVGTSIATIGAVTFAYGLLRFIFFYLATRDGFRSAVLREERLGQVVVTFTTVTCLSSLLFLTSGWTIPISLIVFALVGICQTFVIIISQVVTIAEASAERKGTRAGLLESTTGMGASLGPIAGGMLSGQSLTNAFIVPGISFAGVMILLGTYQALRRPAEV